MTDLRSSVLKARLSKLPAVPPFPVEEEEEKDESRDTFGTAPPLTKRARKKQHTFTPLTAEAYFAEALQVDVQLKDQDASAAFRVYYTPPRPRKPIVKRPPPPPAAGGSLKEVSLNAASIAPPAVDSDDDQVDPAGPGTLFVFHHGAGFSALSSALAAAEITKNTGGEVGVLAYDCRGHGRTKLSGASTPLDMSLSTLSSDLICLLNTMFPSQENMPSLVLAGHSMGGSVVVSACNELMSSGFTRISGVVVLDVVEGTAMDALAGMRSIVLNHPRGFDSVEAAIAWHVDSKAIANADSARVSVPPLVERDPSIPEGDTSKEDEAMEVMADDGSTNETRTLFRYKWKADLLATEPYWKDWFQGLSLRFLGVKTARLLLLAGTDRLDRELLIGQMQGKYQLTVIPDVGHSLQEDAPEKTAQILLDFWRRNERVKLPFKGIKKVGES